MNILEGVIENGKFTANDNVMCMELDDELKQGLLIMRENPYQWE
jgi:hypothetical protein